MKTFLQEIAEKIYKAHPKLDELTLIVPNRRAGLYFRKYLSDQLTKPVFAPNVITIEDFIKSFSTLLVPDKIELVYKLFRVYQQVLSRSGDANEAESFDQFYFWGEMLLRDFEEADKYMVNAAHLFKDLSHQKELDSSFDYLTEEQQAFLKSFWSNFEQSLTANKKRFLYIWRKLPEVYNEFKQSLEKEGSAYEGMIHLIVAEGLIAGKIEPPVVAGKIKFAGFNALTTAEEKIISFFVENYHAEVFWDTDAYYVNNKTQEAGVFFREYQEHPILKKTFDSDIPSNLELKKTNNKAINLYGAAQPIGQAKLMAQILEEQYATGTLNPEETLVVLPDEKLLIPVLHGIPPSIEKLNVTMGFPLSSTPLFNLIEIILDLQISRKDDCFNHRQVLAILGHPYIVAADPVSSNNKRKEILKHNWILIPKNFLATETDVHRVIFIEFEKESFSVDFMKSILDYLKIVVTHIGALKGISEFDREFCLQFLKLFNQLSGIFSSPTGAESLAELQDRKQRQKSLKSFLRLFRQLSRGQKLPFTGEPLRGLQIMGVLETRNLDYKNVFILSLNEGSFPSISSKGSYIPFNIRRAYKLPTAEHQDAMYSYLFYRVLQRAENIHLFYNSETDILGQGEMSRYLQQLIYESGIPVVKQILDNPIEPKSIYPIIVTKDATVMDDLFKLNEGNHFFKGISPSALNTYIECRLRFYFRHVARIKEPKEVEEELDARVLGNFLHDVMERFYKNLNARKPDNLVERADLANYEQEVDRLLDEIFIETYRLDPNKQVTYEGQRLVVKEVVKRFVDRIIEMDKSYAPFYIEGLEQEGLIYEMPIDHPPFKVVIGGKIDRVDRKDDVLRVIDYKTGKDKLNFDSIASLFSREGMRNKAAFQTLLYALLYKKSHLNNGKWNNVKLIPGLINRLNLFDEGFSFGLKVGKDNVTDVEPLLPEFEARMRELFNEMFDAEKPFDQTGEEANCKNCPYSPLCYR
jgi:hypothetical protein